MARDLSRARVRGEWSSQWERQAMMVIAPGWMRLVVVNTGLLPAAFLGRHGVLAAHVASGHLAQFTVTSSRHVPPLVHQSVALPWWGWAGMALFVGSPMIGYLWHLLRGTESLPEAQVV